VPANSETTPRRGFTLIELLVVIFIIAVLIGLILPAVLAAREAANRVVCVNNLKNLGLALHNYHSFHETFPPGAVGPIIGTTQFDQLKQHGLATHLLPYLEQPALANQYRWEASWFDPPNQTVVNAQLGIFQCPSAQADRTQDGSLPTVTPPPSDLFNGTAACGDYAGITYVHAGLVKAGVIDAPSGPQDLAGNYEAVFPLNHTRGFSAIQDGTSHTILMAECAGRPQLMHGRTQVRNTWVSGGPWASRNLLWTRGATVDGTAFFGRCAVNCTNDREVYSFHPGGANVAFADGRVKFLKASIDIRVFARLVTRAGQEIVSDGDY
jgi:prepilin-type N-terminal cleavage/methylation domain-containing protein/prepilin-type processing-associated H-X9-DG protein